LPAPQLRRQLGFFDATMIVMGGIVGSGIFINPYVVAQQVHTPLLILGVWLIGGALAMAGAFIWAELATRLPDSGGQYIYLREAYHPAVAFIYGWVLLLVTQTGGMAAVAVTFAKYFRAITGLGAGDGPIAAAALLGLTAINCLGVRAGSNVQSAMMLLKSGAIAVLVVAGIVLGGGRVHPLPLLDRPVSFDLLRAIGAAMIPVAFAYGGWQTSTFVAGEMRDPRRDLSRGLIVGVIGVIALYLSVNYVCLRVLGPAGLAASQTPASSVMRVALGERGAEFLAVGIAVSTLGFLSQGILTAPRVYYAMARDGLFFESDGNRIFGTVRADPELCDLGGFHFVRAHGQRAVCIPAQRRRTPPRRHLPYAGASLHYRRICGGVCSHRGKYHRRLSPAQCDRPDYPAHGCARVFVLEPAQNGMSAPPVGDVYVTPIGGSGDPPQDWSPAPPDCRYLLVSSMRAPKYDPANSPAATAWRI